MMIVTTPTFEGTRIRQYLGIVTGEAILGANIFKDFFADFLGTLGMGGVLGNEWRSLVGFTL